MRAYFAWALLLVAWALIGLSYWPRAPRWLRIFTSAIAVYVAVGVLLTACAGAPMPYGLGTHVSRQPAGVVITSRTVGLVAGCGLFGFGVQVCDEIRIDPDCGVVVVENPDPARKALLARIASEVRAGCERAKPQEEKK